jgi:hypothetical protein
VPGPTLKHQITELAERTFEALRPYVNLRSPGRWWGGAPRHAVTREMRALLARHRAGERNLRYAGGRPFSPRHVHAAKLTARDIQAAIDGAKIYFTGGLRGLALLYIDLDAHEPWQTDAEETQKVICHFLGMPKRLLVRPSDRGSNIYLALDYRGLTYDSYNQLLRDLGDGLAKLTAHCKCTVEVKGHVQHGEYAGTLAKVPCYGGAAPWTEEDLGRLERLRPLPFQWLGKKVVELEQLPEPAKPVRQPAPRKPGSTSGLPFEVGDVEALLASKAVRSRAAYLYAMHAQPRRGRLTREDFVQAWALLEQLRPNEDGSMPQARVKAIWCRLYEQGTFSRAWDDSRWSAIWRTLADCGFLDVVDTDYWHAEGGKGQAMKWALGLAYSLAGAGAEDKTEASLQEALPPYAPEVHRPHRVSPPRLPFEDSGAITERIFGPALARSGGRT